MKNEKKLLKIQERVNVNINLFLNSFLYIY